MRTPVREVRGRQWRLHAVLGSTFCVQRATRRWGHDRVVLEDGGEVEIRVVRCSGCGTCRTDKIDKLALLFSHCFI